LDTPEDAIKSVRYLINRNLHGPEGHL